ncbi:MAG: hypothetical protein KJ804_13110 [Proteobacteria bacterium]|nr:hypothetical protein [Pseudomonadota bacterium]MBU1059246.1 hypothetical protein [Pseudomonadota bacterium]
MAQKIFQENLRLPLIPGLTVSLLIGTIFWVIIQKALFGSIRFKSSGKFWGQYT